MSSSGNSELIFERNVFISEILVHIHSQVMKIKAKTQMTIFFKKAFYDYLYMELANHSKGILDWS